MAGKSGRKSLLGGLLSIEEEPKPAKDDVSPEVVVRERAPAASISESVVERPPMTLESIIGGAPAPAPKKSAPTPAPAPAGNSERVADLVAAVVNKVPAKNATLQLMVTMRSLEKALSDPVVRREAALNVLISQGVTAEAVAAGEREVETVIEQCFTDWQKQADGLIVRDVDGKRAEAKGLRAQADGKRAEIEAINQTIAGLERDAAALDTAAQTRGDEIQSLKTDIETARIAARASYGV